MKKYIFRYGILAGLFFTALFLYFGLTYEKGKMYLGGSEVWGFGTMILAFCLVAVGIKQYRDQKLDGFISFGKAFVMGLYMVLIASFMYAFSWTLISHFTMPDFYTEYAACLVDKATDAGKSAAEIQKIKDEWAGYKPFFDHPVKIFLMTFLMEPLIPGIIINLIASLILMKKRKNTDQA